MTQEDERIHFKCFILMKESEVAQLRPTLCDPMDCSIQGSSVHWIFQARVPKRVAISFPRRSSRPRDRTQVSHTAGGRFTIWATRAATYHILSPCAAPNLARENCYLVANIALRDEKVAASSFKAFSSFLSFVIVSVTIAFSFSYLFLRLANATSAV